MNLGRLEGWFWQGVRADRPPRDLKEVVRASSGLPALRRLGIYRSAYFARQLNVLRETFERTCEVVGDARFREHALAYLERFPSRNPAIERLGDRFAEYLAGVPENERPLANVVDLARLEWARLEALLAPDPGEGMSLSAWASARLTAPGPELASHVRLLEIDDQALALFRGNPAHHEAGTRVTVAVHRRGFAVVHEVLPDEEVSALGLAVAGASFEEICERFAEPDGVERAALAVARWLRGGWLVLGPALIALGLGGCVADPEPEFDFEVGATMKPGDDCLRCHEKDSEYPTAPIWSAAGTVFPARDSAPNEGVSGVDVVFSDRDENELERLTTNAVGNFYTTYPLPEGFRVALEHGGGRIEMPCPPPAGNCGACHSSPPIGETQGRLFVPGGGSLVEPPLDCATWTRPDP